MREYEFTTVIRRAIGSTQDADPESVLANSELLQYLNEKTRAASRGSKSRPALGNIYALYVLIEDYIRNGYPGTEDYSEYEGARFSELFKRQRELPFGSKLQNHALNSRANDEFRKYFPTCEYIPILRDTESSRYWINERLLEVQIGDKQINIARTIMTIVEEYIEARTRAFAEFVKACSRIKELGSGAAEESRTFVESQLEANVDARIFEIVSFAILKSYYGGYNIYWGWQRDEIQEEALLLYKTGRTNANDGGIDFVMRPLGRFFQVTETVDVRKYFLDIDKVLKFPITFVVKTTDDPEVVHGALEAKARQLYPSVVVVARYMKCIEEIITIGLLKERFGEVVGNGKLNDVVGEILVQSAVEFNFDAEVVRRLASEVRVPGEMRRYSVAETPSRLLKKSTALKSVIPGLTRNPCSKPGQPWMPASAGMTKKDGQRSEADSSAAC